MPVLAGIVSTPLDPEIGCFDVLPVSAKHHDAGLAEPPRPWLSVWIASASVEPQQIHWMNLPGMPLNLWIHRLPVASGQPEQPIAAAVAFLAVCEVEKLS
jgi:hypothetical protein